jgi:hypothetical protein
MSPVRSAVTVIGRRFDVGDHGVAVIEFDTARIGIQ